MMSSMDLPVDLVINLRGAGRASVAISEGMAATSAGATAVLRYGLTQRCDPDTRSRQLAFLDDSCLLERYNGAQGGLDTNSGNNEALPCSSL